MSGIFETGMEEFDNNFIIGDMLLLQKIYNWPDSLVSGVEIFINDSEKIDIFYQDLENKSSFDQFVEKTNIKFSSTLFSKRKEFNTNVEDHK